MSEDNSTIHAVIFRLRDEEFAVEVRAVREVVRLIEITPLPQSPNSIEGIIDLRGHIVAVMDLRKRLGLQDSEKTDKTRIMIVRSNRKIVGLIVDDVREVLKVSRNLLHPTPAMVTSQINHRYISGVIRWNDRIIVLLDLEALLTPAEAEYLRSIKAVPPPKEHHTPDHDPSTTGT
jgi:purine-binding chemotaxis protein CheW